MDIQVERQKKKNTGIAVAEAVEHRDISRQAMEHVDGSIKQCNIEIKI
jgi:hypothetical protein